MKTRTKRPARGRLVPAPNRKSQFGNRKSPDPSQRQVVYRLYAIALAILNYKGMTCRKLAKKLEISEHTVQRDINFLRDQLRHELHYDPYTNSWRYTRKPLSLLHPKRYCPI